MTYFLLMAVLNTQAQNLAVTVVDTVYLSTAVKEEYIDNTTTYKRIGNLQEKGGRRLGEVISEISSVYVKSYGNGQLASLAVRGTSATQTEIEWNGIRLNNPALGQTDLSLFLVGFSDNLRLEQTGYQGNIGGTLKMNTDAIHYGGVTVDALIRAGSFGKFETSDKVSYGNGILSGSTRFAYAMYKNNFPFKNTFLPEAPLVKQTNAAVKQLSFLQDFTAKIGKHHQVGASVWLTDAARLLPPVMSKTAGSEKQDDNSLRFMFDWRANYTKLTLRHTSAFFQDEIRYQNPEAHIDSKSKMQAYRNTFAASYSLPFFLTLGGSISYDHERAIVAEYGGTKSRNSGSLRLYAYYYFLKKQTIRFQVAMRQDVAGKKFSPAAPEFSIGYYKSIKKSRIVWQLMASRNFRFPTLNDLYWVPGGNPQLRLEKSWNGDFKLAYNYDDFVSVSATAFAIYVKDWIQWVSAGSYWQPVNFKRVFSRGLEVAFDGGTYKPGMPNKFVFRVHASYSFTKTTNLDAQGPYDQSKGKQLIYVPLHNLATTVELMYKRFYLRAYNNYTGPVYITTDNSQWLNGYELLDLELGKDFKFGDNNIGLSFRVNNVANTQYQSVAQRPMPGRSYEGTVRFNLERR